MGPRDVVIVAAIRTPFGRYGGALSRVRPDDLAAHVIRTVLERAQLEPEAVDEVFLGDANGAGEDNRNVARMALLLAGLPVEVPGATVNRLCGSGLQAIISGAREIVAGTADVVVAGGVESMSRAPYVMLKPETGFSRGAQEMYDTTLGWRMVNSKFAALYPPISLGETAENVAEKYGISREDQDDFALRSHRLASEAEDAGRKADEIVPVEAPSGKSTTIVDEDEGIRRDSTIDKLASLKPAFKHGGTVTAGNSSQLNDGAAAVVLMSREVADARGVSPLARFIDAASAGVDPALMGIGPVPATEKLLRRTGIDVASIEQVEINEAFAAQVLACIRELQIDVERVNPDGGAIAIGHPLGASGARLVGTLAHGLKRTGKRYGLATMCIGVGQGISALIEGEAV